MVAYLNAFFENGNYKYLPLALADIARARKLMTAAARAAGVPRTNLYQSLSEEGKPAFETIAKVANSLGYRLTLVPVSKPAENSSSAKKRKKAVSHLTTS
ncbi:MAG TPA: putative addiction module antidote protein [Treponema sp.]|nr:putative addiction module antidote protein [Treponema sp.]